MNAKMNRHAAALDKPNLWIMLGSPCACYLAKIHQRLRPVTQNTQLAKTDRLGALACLVPFTFLCVELSVALRSAQPRQTTENLMLDRFL